MKLFWDLADDHVRAAGALPPEPLAMPYARQPHDSPYRLRDFAARWRGLEGGYEAQPGDCPPIRLIAGYGFVVRCPGRVRLRRRASPSRERLRAASRASFGWCDIEGDEWPEGDSGLVASWISTSEFVKVQTGVRIWFPVDAYLYQGPLPNGELADDEPLPVMAGLEYARPGATQTLEGESYGRADLNVIVRLPEAGQELVIERGRALCWLFPSVRASASDLVPAEAGLQRRLAGS